MSINDVKSLTRISGSLTIVDTEELIRERLLKEFPYNDQRVYRGMVGNLASTNAQLLSSKDFKHQVHLNLIKTAKLLWPEQPYDISSNPTSVYDAIQTFLENRDGQIKAFRK